MNLLKYNLKVWDAIFLNIWPSSTRFSEEYSYGNIKHVNIFSILNYFYSVLLCTVQMKIVYLRTK